MDAAYECHASIFPYVIHGGSRSGLIVGESLLILVTCRLVWVSLQSLGLGASLQHYNPVINKEVSEAFGIPAGWELIAEMPFGVPNAEPREKVSKPLEGRFRVFGKKEAN